MGRIGSAKSSIDIAANHLTDSSGFAEPLTAAVARGVRVRVIYDDGHRRADSDGLQALLCAAGATVLEEKANGTLHHKYAVIDWPDVTEGGAEPPPPIGRPVVITGSANWSRNGMERNDENVVAIQSVVVAAAFTQDFEALLAGAGGTPPADLCAAVMPTATATPADTPGTTPTVAVIAVPITVYLPVATSAGRAVEAYP